VRPEGRSFYETRENHLQHFSYKNHKYLRLIETLIPTRGVYVGKQPPPPQPPTGISADVVLGNKYEKWEEKKEGKENE
jgi:hypothetical protein